MVNLSFKSKFVISSHFDADTVLYFSSRVDIIFEIIGGLFGKCFAWIK